MAIARDRTSRGRTHGDAVARPRRACVLSSAWRCSFLLALPDRAAGARVRPGVRQGLGGYWRAVSRPRRAARAIALTLTDGGDRACR